MTKEEFKAIIKRAKEKAHKRAFDLQGTPHIKTQENTELCNMLLGFIYESI